MIAGRRFIRFAVHAALLALSAALVVRILVGADLRRVGEMLAASGAALVWVVLPYAAAIAIDTAGWQVLLAALGHRLSGLRLFALRPSTEAVRLSAPLGTVGAESLKAYLLERRLGVPVPDAVASIAYKKTLLTVALGAYLATSALLGFGQLERASAALIGRAGLPWIVLATSVALVAVAALAFASLRRGVVAAGLHALLRRIRWFEERRARFLAVDAHCTRLARGGARLALATAWFYLGWLVESLETYVLLHVLGAEVPFVAVLAIEASVALIRSLTVFAPAGLGFQDASYLGFFHAFALPDW